MFTASAELDEPGKEGLAVTLITARQKYALRDLERTTRAS